MSRRRAKCFVRTSARARPWCRAIDALDRNGVPPRLAREILSRKIDIDVSFFIPRID
jgi:hypothetical protein